MVAITPEERSADAEARRDEVKYFQDRRSVGASECAWRIFSFDMNGRYPAVVRLPVHLEQGQTCYHETGEQRQELARQANRGPPPTELTAWFEWNCQHRDNPSLHHLYADMPAHCVYVKSKKLWKERENQNRPSVGRVYTVPPSSGEQYYLRLLLYNEHSRSKTSFKDLRTYNGEELPSFRDVCREIGLLEDDAEYDNTMEDAAQTKMPKHIRQLFVTILLFCRPADPAGLFDKYWSAMGEDFKHALERGRIDTSEVSDEVVKTRVLMDLQDQLESQNKRLQDFAMPRILPELRSIVHRLDETLQLATRPREIREELSYDRNAERQKAEENMTTLTPNAQLPIVNKIKRAIDNHEAKALFIQAIAGAGKTFVLNTLLSYVRGKGEVALAVATSGIAATLLQGGRTAHSRFRIPIDVDHTSYSSCSAQSATAELFRMARLIVWDEAPMAHKHMLECLDRSLRDLCGNDEPFGGKIIVLTGDYRQNLPVIPRANRGQIVQATHPNSHLWRHFTIEKLEENLRLRGADARTQEMGRWLLRVGDGDEASLPDGEGPEDFIRLPDDLCTPKNLDELIAATFHDLGSNYNNGDWMAKRAILAPTNNTVADINDKVLSMIPGEEQVFYSSDQLEATEGSGHGLNVPHEYIQSLTPSGMPPHALKLKPGTVVMCMRNMNPAAGLCNGTRLIVKRVINGRLLEATIAGTDKVVFIPRIKLQPTKGEFPFSFTRLQFPVRLSFAMTINKSQGQSMETVGVYLDSPCFTHGQLYVAASRVTSPQGLKIMAPGGITRNIVFKDALLRE